VAPKKLTIIWDNRWFDAAVLTPSSAAAGYPAACLQDAQQTRTWRTTGLTGASLAIDLGAAQYCSCLALINHNLTFNGKVRVQAAAVPDFGTLLKDDEYDAWPDIIGAGEGGAGQHGAGGVLLDSERRYYVPNPLRILYFEPPEGQDHVSARYWRLLFEDAGNPDGFVEIGRIFLGLYDEYARNPGYGWGYSYQDDSSITRSPGGQPWTDRRLPYRILDLPWKAFLNEDKYWRLAFFLKQVGISRDFVIDCFPAGRPSERFYTALYGRISGAGGSSGFSTLTADENKYSGFQLSIIESL
jgi:hypothetical protein